MEQQVDEQEWLVSTDPPAMLATVRSQASGRKLRLFAVACARLQWGAFLKERSRGLLDLAERQADGQASRSELDEAARWGHCEGLIWALRPDAAEAASSWASWPDLTEQARADLWRELFGNPFRHLAIEPSWLRWNAGTVPKLAQAIYQDRRYADLPILADALEETGCANEVVLGHCRQPGKHVRGCWLIDALLGKR
jgi:hypothetical protein